MLRQPGSVYEAGRSSTLLKVKSFLDAEARVVEHLAGAGHPCRVVASALGDTAEKRDQMAHERVHLEWSRALKPCEVAA